MSQEHKYSKEELDYIAFLVQNGYRNIKLLPNNRWVAILPLLFTHAVIIGKMHDRTSYDDRWCYHDWDSAAKAMEEWNGEGEPTGWHRHPASGRRYIDGELKVFV
jgi:hypothetical protein